LKEWIVIPKIKALYDEGKGLSIRAIARELDISRNTVRKSLAMEEEAIQAQKSQRERTKILDQHRDYIVHLLQTYPELSAVKIRDRLLRKHPELSVSSRTVRRFVRRVKETVSCHEN
jgi:transposase